MQVYVCGVEDGPASGGHALVGEQGPSSEYPGSMAMLSRCKHV